MFLGTRRSENAQILDLNDSEFAAFPNAKKERP